MAKVWTGDGKLAVGVSAPPAKIESAFWYEAQRQWLQGSKYLWLSRLNAHEQAKRALDVTMAASMLIGLLPLFALLALIVKLTDGGPALHWQMRVGRWGKEFPFPKFRSMRMDAEKLLESLLSENQHQAGVTFKIRRDPRVTRIGALLRRFSLDELPQIWCVLKGEMSLVGPRPPLPREVQYYSLNDRRRLDVKPGLTCIWQVSGRSDIPFPEQVKLDVDYIERRSLWLDLQLLARTVSAVISGKGAY